MTLLNPYTFPNLRYTFPRSPPYISHRISTSLSFSFIELSTLPNLDSFYYYIDPIYRSLSRALFTRRVFCEILQYFEERFNYITMYRVYVQGDRPRILTIGFNIRFLRSRSLTDMDVSFFQCVTYICLCIHTHTHTHTHARARVCMCVYACTYVYAVNGIIFLISLYLGTRAIHSSNRLYISY